MPFCLDKFFALFHLVFKIFFFLLFSFLKIHPHFSYFSLQKIQFIMQSLILISLGSNILAGLLREFSIMSR